MEISIFLAKLFGIYLLIKGLYVLVRQQTIPVLVDAFAKSEAAMTSIGFLEVFLSLVLLLSHNVWVQDWRVLITVLLWAMFIEGLVTVFFPERIIKIAKTFQHKKYYTLATGITLIIGVYLTFYGFTA